MFAMDLYSIFAPTLTDHHILSEPGKKIFFGYCVLKISGTHFSQFIDQYPRYQPTE
jgi:hypothetical protein